MNPYKEDGLRARLSFDPAYCKRCTAPPSVNDGYITGPGCGRRGACAPRRPFRPFAPSPVPPLPAIPALSLRSDRLLGAAAAPPRRGATPPRARPLRRETLSPRLKLSFGNAATGPL